MRRVNVFLIVLIVALASLIVATVVGFALFSSAPASQYPSGSWMGDMWGDMGNMMGGSGTTGVQNPSLAYFGVVFVVLVGVAIAGIAGLAYYVAFPEIRAGVARNVAVPVLNANGASVGGVVPVRNGISAYDSVAKTLTGEERKVVEVLVAHDGKYLQKYIRKEADLSRLKTHRIVARLAERGIVSLEKSGNTNQVLLADWLKQAQ